MPKRTHEAAMQTRQLILDAAYNLFSTKGFEKTSLSDIARAAQVTRGAIYWHFEDKNELLCELCKDLADKVNLVDNLQNAAAPDEPDPLGQLKQWMLSHSSDKANFFFNSNFVRNLRLLSHGGASGGTADEVSRRLQELPEYMSQLLLEGIKNAIAHRQLPADVDPDAARACLFSLLYAYCSRENRYFSSHRPHFIFRQLVDFVFAHLGDLKRLPGADGTAAFIRQNTLH